MQFLIGRRIMKHFLAVEQRGFCSAFRGPSTLHNTADKACLIGFGLVVHIRC